MHDSSLLLEIGVPFFRGPGGLQVEAQALNGLRLWTSHFDRVTVCATELPADRAPPQGMVWGDPSTLAADGRLALEPLPWAYHPRDHFRVRRQVRRRFDALVAEHRYLCFSSLGAFGSWGNFGVAAAMSQRRSYSLWLDWVLHEMTATRRFRSANDVKNFVVEQISKRNAFEAVRHCSLGLFHGQTVYDAYAPLCRQPALVHNIHVHPQDAIGDEALAVKLASCQERRDLVIGYVGRVHPMKAPLQWIDAIAKVVARAGADRVSAEWLGEGPLLETARQKVAALGLERSIRFPGFVADRAALLSFLRRIDVLAFTHVTPESPRCLIEALISGTPLVGYESAYARELTGDRGGALLSPLGDTDAFAASLVALADDRGLLARSTRQAASARPLYNDEAVFRHRSDLIKRYL